MPLQNEMEVDNGFQFTQQKYGKHLSKEGST